MENPEKISLQFELLNTYYSKIACKMSHTPKTQTKRTTATSSTAFTDSLRHVIKLQALTSLYC